MCHLINECVTRVCIIITISLHYSLGMRRKSERNKAKGSPEKKVEKPTRKSTRRRKRSPSTSPEQDTLVEDTSAKSAILLKEISEKEPSVQTRLQSKELVEQSQGHEEKVYPSEIDIKVDSPEDEDNGGSVWKVARADASPGEIQKLKLCRQRNTSEASSDTAPSSRKTVKSSGKWQEGGEGIAEEADSADEQLVSCTRMLSSAEQPNDPSSSYPGQDSNEEVSDSKEILPETTSANLLSDDKPNIDQHGESNEANCAAQIVDSEPGKPGSTTPASSPSANGDDTSEKTATAVAEIREEVNEEKTAEDITEKPTEAFREEVSVETLPNKDRDTSSEDEDDKMKTHRPADSSSDSNDESRPKSSRASSDQTSPRLIRRKPRSKYRDSSNSETPDSEDEPIERKVSESYAEEEEEEKQSREYSRANDKDQSVSPERTNSHSNNVEKVEIEQCETVPEKSEESANEKPEQIAPTSTQTVVHKPVKVNLKRSL